MTDTAEALRYDEEGIDLIAKWLERHVAAAVAYSIFPADLQMEHCIDVQVRGLCEDPSVWIDEIEINKYGQYVSVNAHQEIVTITIDIPLG